MHRRSLLASLALAPSLASRLLPSALASSALAPLFPIEPAFGQQDHHGDAAAALAAPPVQLRAIASFSILADLTHQTGGDAVSVETLVGPDADVHIYEPRPRDLRSLTQANLLVTNGLGLEGWMNRLVAAAGFKGQTVVAAATVTPRTMQEAGGAVGIDPHAWQDPANAVRYVHAIADGLTAADPDRGNLFRETAERYAARITAAGDWVQARLAPIPAAQRRIITTHDAFGYYGARFGIEFLSAEGISTEFEPSAKAIALLIKQIKRERVRAVFIENMTSPRIAEMLARESGAVLGGTVYSDALSPAGGPAATYLDMITHNTELFARAMHA